MKVRTATLRLHLLFRSHRLPRPLIQSLLVTHNKELVFFLQGWTQYVNDSPFRVHSAIMVFPLLNRILRTLSNLMIFYIFLKEDRRFLYTCLFGLDLNKF